MTIACVYLSPEGVVLGADSTSSVASSQGFHFFDFNQKLFEIGENSTIGLITWGLGGLNSISYRTLVATFADELQATPAINIAGAMQRWADKFWLAYSVFDQTVRFCNLDKKAAEGQVPNVFGVRTGEEEKEWSTNRFGLGVGFCIAGYVSTNRIPEAHSVFFLPGQQKPTPVQMAQNSIQWWGIPNYFTRLLVGADSQVLDMIHASGKWQGTRQELDDIARTFTIVPNGTLPIRDAVDYVHTCIYCTVKAIKFSGLPQVCGGPIELAVITSDRKFRWVRHKQWDAAIDDGGL